MWGQLTWCLCWATSVEKGRGFLHLTGAPVNTYSVTVHEKKRKHSLRPPVSARPFEPNRRRAAAMFTTNIDHGDTHSNRHQMSAENYTLGRPTGQFLSNIVMRISKFRFSWHAVWNRIYGGPQRWSFSIHYFFRFFRKVVADWRFSGYIWQALTRQKERKQYGVYQRPALGPSVTAFHKACQIFKSWIEQLRCASRLCIKSLDAY